MNKLYSEVISYDVRSDRNKAKKKIGANIILSESYEELCKNPDNCICGVLVGIDSDRFKIDVNGTNVMSKWIRFEI